MEQRKTPEFSPHPPAEQRPGLRDDVRSGRLALWIWLGGGLTALLLVFAAGLWLVENPSSVLYRAFVAAAELSLPPERNENGEFLVFLSEDTKANREILYRVSRNVTYVADSLLPRVVVVKITENAEETLAALRRLEFVSLAMRYNPSFGCH